MPGIFISYRRGSAASASARLLRNDLVARFGEDQVLLDVDTIEPGVDFRAAIEEAVVSCDALLAVIDPLWLDARDDKNRRRLDDENDLVRLEVATGLERGARVVPVLVQGATMPNSDELPDVLTALAGRNASVLTHERWDSDIEPLLRALTHVIEDSETSRRAAPGASTDLSAGREAPGAVAAAQGATEPVAPTTAAQEEPVGDIPATERRASWGFTRLTASGLAYVYVDTIQTLLDASEHSPVVVSIDSPEWGLGHYMTLRRFERKVLPPLSKTLEEASGLAGWGDKNEIKRTVPNWKEYFPGRSGLGVYLYESRRLVSWSKVGGGASAEVIVSAARLLLRNEYN